MNEHLIKTDPNATVQMAITPQSAGWRYLSYSVVTLGAGESCTVDTDGVETALVPLSGAGRVTVDDAAFELSRSGVFDAMPHVLYVPPGPAVTVVGSADFTFAYGSAPAEGRYPVRLFAPREMKAEVRGGGMATRQVNHILAHPLPAERLILFEVYVSGGMYSGWPPHCHDGFAGSPYLEETYYYRVEPREHGYCIHRNYRTDNDFDELFTVRDGDCVLVTQGFHPVAVPPGSRVYFLNFLAGELEDEARGTPPYDDPAWAFMKDDYTANAMALPVVQP